jgi:hypothetical protein
MRLSRLRSLRPALLAGLVVVGVSCGGSSDTSGPAPLTPAEVGEAREVARQFFAAVESADCDKVRALRGTPQSAEECAEFVDEWNDHQVALLEIVDASVDARDRRAVIVRSRVTQERHERTMLVRVEKHDAGWVVSL